MFDNIARKIQNVATVFFVLGAFLTGCCVIAAFALGAWSLIIVGIVIFFSSWISAILIYGFGEIIEKLDCIAHSSNDHIQQNKSE